MMSLREEAEAAMVGVLAVAAAAAAADECHLATDAGEEICTADLLEELCQLRELGMDWLVRMEMGICPCPGVPRCRWSHG